MTDDPDPDWRDLLDIALDTMMVGRKAEAEAMFDRLDTLHEGWKFEVTYRERRKRQRVTVHRFLAGKVTRSTATRTSARRTRTLIATMLYLAQPLVAHRLTMPESQGPRARRIRGEYRELARSFDVGPERVSQWVSDGLDDLELRNPDGSMIAIESDFDPGERAAALRERIRIATMAVQRRRKCDE